MGKRERPELEKFDKKAVKKEDEKPKEDDKSKYERAKKPEDTATIQDGGFKISKKSVRIIVNVFFFILLISIINRY